MDKPWKVICAFVGVFIAGAVFGGFFTLRSAGKWGAGDRPRSVPAPKAAPVAVQPGKDAPPPGRIFPQVMRQFTQRLNPTPEQQKAIRPIVSRAAEDLQRMQREHLTDTTRTTERMYADVAAILTPAQRTKLEQMRDEMRERVRREKEKRGEVQPAADVLAKPGAKPGGAARPEKATKSVPGGTP
jgi:Spy/CpxP family protein refolding chaperone